MNQSNKITTIAYNYTIDKCILIGIELDKKGYQYTIFLDRNRTNATLIVNVEPVNNKAQ